MLFLMIVFFAAAISCIISYFTCKASPELPENLQEQEDDDTVLYIDEKGKLKTHVYDPCGYDTLGI